MSLLNGKKVERELEIVISMTPPHACIFTFFLVCLNSRIRGRERKCELSFGSLSRIATMAALVQTEAKNLEVHLGLPHGGQKPNHSGFLSKHIGVKLDQK